MIWNAVGISSNSSILIPEIHSKTGWKAKYLSCRGQSGAAYKWEISEDHAAQMTPNKGIHSHPLTAPTIAFDTSFDVSYHPWNFGTSKIGPFVRVCFESLEKEKVFQEVSIANLIPFDGSQSCSKREESMMWAGSIFRDVDYEITSFQWIAFNKPWHHDIRFSYGPFGACESKHLHEKTAV